MRGAHRRPARNAARLGPSYLIVLTALTACDRSPRDQHLGRLPADESIITFIGPPASNPQGEWILEGARSTAARYPNVKLITLLAKGDSEADYEEALGRALSTKPRALCVYVSNPEAADEPLRKLVQKSTFLITVGTRVSGLSAYGHVDSDLPAAAEALGSNLGQLAGGGQSYLLLHEAGRSTLATQVYNRFMLRARGQIGMTLLDEINTDDETHAGQAPLNLLRDMLGRFKNAALVVTLTPAPWLAAPPDRTLGAGNRLVSLPASVALWPALRQGRAAALAGPLDGELGQFAIELAMMGITDSEKPGLTRIARSEVVTAKNFEDFASRYARAAGVPVATLLADKP